MRLGALRQIGRAARNFGRGAGDFARHIGDGLNRFQKPVGRHVEIELNLFVGAAESFGNAEGEVAVGKRFQPAGDGRHDAGLLAGDLGPLLGGLGLRFGIPALLFFGLLALQFRLVALLGPALFERRVAERHDGCGHFADFVRPIGAGHIQIEAAAGNLQHAAAQAIKRP